MMLTRGQVAKRLGKSIATVRRMEGGALHPKQDLNGIFRFDPTEVERVLRQPSRASAQPAMSRRSEWFESEVATRDHSYEMSAIERGGEEERGREEGRLKAEERRASEERVRRATEEAVREEFARREREDDERRRAEQIRGEQQHREADAAQDLATKTELLSFLEMRSDREVRRLMRDPEFAAIVDAVLGTE